jgi:pimeloyl-ACP methyl ester carboxylesterase
VAYAINPLDGTRIYYEDDGGEGVLSSCTADSSTASSTCASPSLARALPVDEFRTIYVDHRGLGRSDKAT